MNDMLKLIIKQNLTIYRLLQYTLYYLGMSEEKLQDILKVINKEIEEVDKEMEEN